MLIKPQFTVPKVLIQSVLDILPFVEGKLCLPADGKFTINYPEGDFFYDKWQIKKEYKNTPIENLLNTLKCEIGEARIIVLKPKTSYAAHSDIDDRYHLNFQGENAFLLDLESNRMHVTECNGIWYEMNAGKLHSATNLGEDDRIQLVVRKLLQRNELLNPVSIKVVALNSFDENNRYFFDQHTSKWLNYANKNGKINNFKYINENEITLDIEKEEIDALSKTLPAIFKITT